MSGLKSCKTCSALQHDSAYKEAKCMVAIAFPAELDFSPYCTFEAAKHQGCEYILESIPLHWGNTAKSGHWALLTRTSPTEFVLRNDDRVPVNVYQSEVLTNYTRDAVGLVYRKKSLRCCHVCSCLRQQQPSGSGM